MIPFCTYIIGNVIVQCNSIDFASQNKYLSSRAIFRFLSYVQIAFQSITVPVCYYSAYCGFVVGFLDGLYKVNDLSIFWRFHTTDSEQLTHGWHLQKVSDNNWQEYVLTQCTNTVILTVSKIEQWPTGFWCKNGLPVF